jgi:hypothetical protein
MNAAFAGLRAGSENSLPWAILPRFVCPLSIGVRYEKNFPGHLISYLGVPDGMQQ